ncbi:MAG: ABC transporter permease [Chloroflexi bacterium]|nr:ABC transporter permease [Chloroflexota bacterium]
MGRYILRRIVLLIPTLIGISILVFALMRFLPGDVVQVLVGAEAQITPEQRATLYRMFGLDAPIYVQYLRWVGALLQGDMGTSLRTSQPVTSIIAGRMPITFELALFSALLSWIIAIPLGMLSAVRRNSLMDLLTHVLGLIGLSLPNFWLAAMFLLITSVILRWQPQAEWVSFLQDPWTNMQQVLLPVLSLSAALVAVVMRMVRSSLLEVLGQDYIRTARAKGLSSTAILFGHALKNAAIPVITVMGVQVGYLLGGAVVIEQIFGMPGIGWTVLNGIYQRDYPLVQGAVFFIAIIFVLINLLVDVLYAYLDPRIRYK